SCFTIILPFWLCVGLTVAVHGAELTLSLPLPDSFYQSGLSHPALGFGVDPELRINVFDELKLGESYAGVFQVQGFHNESRAFLFQDSWRNVRVKEDVAEVMLQKLRDKTEFTVLVTLKQERLNSGVLLSIHYAEHRYLELESSGQRNEIRLHYRTRGQRQHTEGFPYSLADDRWHKLSVAVSVSHVVLHVDCNRIYERVIENPSMDIPSDTTIWLGQRNQAHGYFKVCCRDSYFPENLLTCPTCNDFHGLVQKIMELQDVLAKTSSKLSRAEEKMQGLDGCYCERSCSMNGELYREDEGWTDGCRNCSCYNGTVQCETILCPPPQCPPDSAPAYVPGTCCKECQLSVSFPLSGHHFCVEGHSPSCVENSECVNLEAGSCCSCKDGYRALRDDSAYCGDIDECAEGKHYCRENTMCVNTPGSFMCICHTGYIRIDDYSCTERDECTTGLHSCDENAICYVGNGTVCRALCDGLCQNGGSCVNPDTCICQQGFTGKRCETDIDECTDGFVECDSRAICVNLPGWYHCECRDGYHDNGMFSANGESCEDIDECATERHSCANDTVCFNVDGGYDCRCPHGKNCTGDCNHDNKHKHNGQIWVLDNDRCSVCSCQSGLVMCRRMVCDCESTTADLFCCPECNPGLSSQCLHQNRLITYSSGDTWVENCQQCQCMSGEVDCWPMSCPPVVDCEFTQVPEGQCCPRCITDPCQADTVRNDITKTCVDENGLTRFSGAAWTKHRTECTLCQCKLNNNQSSFLDRSAE
uniref:Neural EGFL like 2 n=1 Tax=Oncorhynchus tshawytscha TaxID=74940 RepID=A0AAZ3QU08_ONCTS